MFLTGVIYAICLQHPISKVVIRSARPARPGHLGLARPGPALPALPALPGPALPGPALPGPALPGRRSICFAKRNGSLRSRGYVRVRSRARRVRG